MKYEITSTPAYAGRFYHAAAWNEAGECVASTLWKNEKHATESAAIMAINERLPE